MMVKPHVLHKKKTSDPLPLAKILPPTQTEMALIFESVPMPMILLDREGRICRANRIASEVASRSAEALIGLKLGEALGCPNAFFDPHGCGFSPSCAGCRMQQMVQDTFKTGNRYGKVEIALPGVQGKRTLQVSTTLLTAPNDPHVLLITDDITERKWTENIIGARLRLMDFAATHSLDELLQATLDEAEALTGSTIGFYHFLEADQTTLSLQTWSTNTLQNMCKADGKGRHYDVSQAGVWVDCISERRPVIHNDYAALPHRKGMPEDHAPVIRELVAPVFRGDQIVAILGVGNKPQDYDTNDVEIVSLLADLAWDIAEHKRAEEALRQSHHRLEVALAELKEAQVRMVQQERLAAVGQLTAGIAHDFNNILTSMLGFAELLQSSPNTPEAIRADLEYIITPGQRAAHLIRQLLDFSRKSIRQPQRLDLVSFIKEAVRFLSRTIPENIRLSLKIEPGSYLIEADPIQIQQVLTNLAVNARDAMPAGGMIKVGLLRTEMVGVERCVECCQVIEGEWIVLAVTDTGSGIPPSVLPHIFEPFFTTKEVGEGSGLGLAQVLGIVQQHAGHITVTSQVGQGTTFTVYLPPLRLPQAPVKTQDAASVLPGQSETILLVEDEPIVLEVSRRMLEFLGYQIVTARNGREALTVYEEHSHKIALVLSDMVMPDIEGMALFKALKAQNPDIKVVIMSGYPLEENETRLLEQGIVDWFQKPISFENFSQIISRALSRNGRLQ